MAAGDSRGQASNVKPGFVQPLDFSTFTQQFVNEEKDGQAVSFGQAKTAPGFGADSKKSGAFQIPTSDFSPFQGPIFLKPENKTGFVQPLQFGSPFNQDSNTRTYKTNINPTHQTVQTKKIDQVPKASSSEEEEDDDDSDEDSYFKSSRVQSYRQPSKPKKPHTYGKSSYPSFRRKTTSPEHYSGVISESDDVEMILPKNKVLFLPMVNGKPKPYDGYRAAPESDYDTFEGEGRKESRQLREKRLNEGEIIYGKPKIPFSDIYHKHLKRSPAEYYGGIYPYYDYSDAKLSVGGDTDPNSDNQNKKSAASQQRNKKAYPKKHRQSSRDKYPSNPYKYPKDKRRKNKDDDSIGYASGESSEEIDDSEEESDESKADRPLYKYTYDDTVRVPPLEIKRYPYEKHLRDSAFEGSRKDESVEYDDNIDEYTAGYERYIKTLPSDLETYFGSPEISEKFSAEATESLENNKNCRKIDTPAKTEEGTEQSKAEGETAETQICYVCSDPKTGDSYEQCAYRTLPKKEKYFFGGSTSFHSNETAEPSTYRYKRSLYNFPYAYSYSPLAAESSGREKYSEPEDSEESYKPKKKYKKKYKKYKALASNIFEKKQPKKRYDENQEYDPFFKLQAAHSTKRGRAIKPERPPKSYDGPKYTYEGPEETYEGPSQPYEGPKETYEGPAEPYEGPINQEYYDNVDERIRDDEEEEEEQPNKKQEPQGSSPTKKKYYKEYNRQSPKKRQSYSSEYGSPYSPSRYEDGDYEDSYKPYEGYISDYRFGPEHFVDEAEEEPEDTKQTKKIKPTSAPKETEKRGPQKFTGSEARPAPATNKQEKEEAIGGVKTFKNGDVCQKKRKEGLICMECKNQKTGATYEQCQYSTKPKDKYYAYGSQKSYTTKNPKAEQKEDESEASEDDADSDSDQFPEKSDIVEKKILITTHSKVFGYDPIPTEGLAVAESKNSPYFLPKDLYGENTDNIETLDEDEGEKKDNNNKNFRESIERIEPRDGIEGLDEYLYDAEDSEKKATEEEKQSYRTYDDYFHELFPEFGKSVEPVPESDEKEESESETHLSFDPFSNVRKFHEENNRPEKYSRDDDEDEEEEKDAEASRPEHIRLKDRESRIPRDFFIPYNEEEHKKDLEKALGEFQNRDWSNCTKIVKKKLTCYQCVDKNGVNNEECMYVEASQPIKKNIAYHEKKEFNPEHKNKTTEPKLEGAQAEKSEKNLKRFRKDKNSPAELIDIAELPKDAEYVEETTKKGDFEGVEKPTLNITEDVQSESSSEQPVTKPKIKKSKRNSKKRNKTLRKETTTERFEKIRKRKFPLKKFTETEPEVAEDKPENGTFGMKMSETEKKPNQNETQTTT